MPTTVPAVLEALRALAEAVLVQADPFPAAQVIPGPYGTVTTHSSRFLVVGSDDEDSPIVGTREPHAMTLTVIGEDYRVPLGFSVSLPGADTLDESTARAMDDLALLDAAIRQDPTLAGACLHAELSGDFELKRRSDANARNASVNAVVRVQAHTT